MAEQTQQPARTPSRPAGRGIPAALTRYRAMAYTVGVLLLVLVLVAVPLRYIWDVPAVVAVVGPLHGVLYMIYLAASFDMALRARWSAKATVLVLLAGTIPVLSFVAERTVTRRMRAGERL